MVKENQRVRITKQIFQNTLIKLIEKKNLYEITVSELCKACELNRSTFYKHYNTVIDIVNEMQEEFFEQSQRCINGIDLISTDGIVSPIYSLLCFYKDHPEASSFLLNHLPNKDLPLKAIKLSFEKINKLIVESELIKSSQSTYLLNYIIYGSLSIVKGWVNSGFVESPMDMANMIYTTSINALGLSVNDFD